MLHLVSGISYLSLFVNLILLPVLPFPTPLFLHPSFLSLLIHTLIQTLIAYSFKGNSKVAAQHNNKRVLNLP